MQLAIFALEASQVRKKAVCSRAQRIGDGNRFYWIAAREPRFLRSLKSAEIVGIQSGAKMPRHTPTQSNAVRKVRIYDIAARAGVSPATVSAMLSGKRPVAASTRARIEAAIAELGYRANAAARALAHGRTETIALLIPPAGRSLSTFEVDFIATAVEAARAANYDVLVSTSLEEEKVFTRLIEEERVDGVILLEVCLEDHRIERLRQAEVPFVAVGRSLDFSSYNWVDIDFERLVRSFVRHLADLRHKELLLLNSPKSAYDRGYGPAHRAQNGFLNACEEFGLIGHVAYCEPNPESGLRLMEEIVESGPHFSAIAAINDYALGGVYQALAAAGLRVPQDVSVIALADPRWAETLSPRLTSAAHPVAEMGRLSVRLLLDQLAGADKPPEGHLILPPISLRESTGAAPSQAVSSHHTQVAGESRG